MRLNQITPTSYFLHDGHGTIGLVCSTDQGYSIFKREDRTDFNSWEDLYKSLGKPKVTATTSVSMVKNIRGYHIRHDEAELIDNPDLPTYKVKNTAFAAGYWLIKYENCGGYVISECPKINTITKYEQTMHKAIGPFKSRLEALQEQNAMNKALE
jgi:hypothetical protein